MILNESLENKTAVLDNSLNTLGEKYNDINSKITNMLYGKVEPSSIDGGDGKNVIIAFGKAFNKIPLFLCNFSIDNETSGFPIVRNSVLKITKEYAIVRIANDGTSSYNISLSWLAIGI